MEVINKPGSDKTSDSNEAGFNPPPNSDEDRGDNHDNRPNRPYGKMSKTALSLRRVAFVLCGAMFGVAFLFTIFTVIVTSTQPELTPNLPDASLHQDELYIKFDDEDFYRSLVVIRDQIADPDPQEVTQIDVGRSFKLVFTPKQMDIPENYRIVYRDQNMTAENAALESNLDRKAGRNVEGGFDTLTISPHNGKWPVGRFLILYEDGGMFGGRLFAYFTVNEAPSPAK
ncbi:MAG: hypothetical protein HXX08_08530 [Chloroflexi bacterium]|uniref:Uncharacterized protein n=1 Tax=Candidatus Chlorohelix allophototropha TaxID=3003348 RepID=A0A8T7M1J9_9CHLR|nr:hypothetical protein [Chloroflexota bacterium]WJW67771.1 hypothetical protein OZ401_001050 [Chloroflexota bacterium L227-S17]